MADDCTNYKKSATRKLQRNKKQKDNKPSNASNSHDTMSNPMEEMAKVFTAILSDLQTSIPSPPESTASLLSGQRSLEAA